MQDETRNIRSLNVTESLWQAVSTDWYQTNYDNCIAKSILL
jgi:hypothetical protein